MAEELVGAVICRKRGDTAPDKVTINDSDTGAARDITGFQYVMTINTRRRPTPTFGQQLVQITGTITDAPNGIVEFPFNGGSDADQEPGEYWYDIQQTDAGGLIKTIAKNQYIFHQDVTK